MSTSTAPMTPSTGFNDSASGGPAPHLSVHSFGLTDRGRVRPSNEDHFLIADMAKAMHVSQSSRPHPETQFGEERGFLFVVADGMGGHQAGERASSLALETIEDFMLNTFKWFFHLQGPEEGNALTEVQAALRKADERVYEKAMRRPELYGMGTTLTMAYALNTDLYVVHVGDTRCYLARDRRLYQLTHDHTLAGELVRRGFLEPQEAVHHHLRHVVTNAVGGPKLGVEVEAQKQKLEPGDVLMLCSDGLTDMVPVDRILSALMEEANPQRACERLVAQANESGGKDNITVIVAQFGD